MDRGGLIKDHLTKGRKEEIWGTGSTRKKIQYRREERRRKRRVLEGGEATGQSFIRAEIFAGRES